MKLNTWLWIGGLIVLLVISFTTRRAPGAGDPLTDPSYRQRAQPETGDGRVAGVPMPTVKALPRGGGPRPLLRLADSRVEEIRTRSRSAMGYDHLAQLTQGLLLEGDTRLARGAGRFSLLFNSAGCYLQEVVGPLSVALGYDGTASWVLASTRGPADMEIADLTIPQVVTWVQAGRWLTDDGPFDVAVASGQNGALPTALELTLKSDGTRARMELDANSWLPTSVIWDTNGRSERWLLDEWTTSQGISLPRHLVRDRGNERAEFQIRTVGKAPVMAGNPYSPMQSRIAEIRARREGRPLTATNGEPA